MARTDRHSREFLWQIAARTLLYSEIVTADTVQQGARVRLQASCAQSGSSVVVFISSMDSREVMLNIFTCEMSAW